MRQKLIFLLLAVASIALLFGAVRLFNQNFQLKEQLAQLERSRQKLEERHDQLSGSFEALSDPEVLEREARLKLNYQKEGEHSVIIVPPRQADLATTSEGEYNGFLANPVRWFKFIFGG